MEGPAGAIMDKIIVGLTEAKRSRLIAARKLKQFDQRGLRPEAVEKEIAEALADGFL